MTDPWNIWWGKWGPALCIAAFFVGWMFMFLLHWHDRKLYAERAANQREREVWAQRLPGPAARQGADQCGVWSGKFGGYCCDRPVGHTGKHGQNCLAIGPNGISSSIAVFEEFKPARLAGSEAP